MLLAFYLFAVKSGDDFSRTVLFLLGIYELIGGYLVRNLWKKHVMRRQSKEGENSLLLLPRQSMLSWCWKMCAAIIFKPIFQQELC